MRVHPGLLLVAAVTLLPHPAAAKKSYAQLAEKAEALKGLGTFLKSYVGDCHGGDEYDQRDCRTNTKNLRKGYTGKLLSVRLSDKHGQLLQVVKEISDTRLKLGLTPFFDAIGYALSKGKPKLDRRGRPRLRLMIFSVDLPDGMDRRKLELLMRSGNVKMELLFVPTGAWKLKKDMEGVKARFRGLRITSARTGDLIGETTW